MFGALNVLMKFQEYLTFFVASLCLLLYLMGYYYRAGEAYIIGLMWFCCINWILGLSQIIFGIVRKIKGEKRYNAHIFSGLLMLVLQAVMFILGNNGIYFSG